MKRYREATGNPALQMSEESVKKPADSKLNQLSALAQVVMLLTCIQEVSGSSLGRGTGYPKGKGFLSCPQALQANSGLLH